MKNGHMVRVVGVDALPWYLNTAEKTRCHGGARHEFAEIEGETPKARAQQHKTMSRPNEQRGENEIQQGEGRVRS